MQKVKVGTWKILKRPKLNFYVKTIISMMKIRLNEINGKLNTKDSKIEDEAIENAQNEAQRK